MKIEEIAKALDAKILFRNPEGVKEVNMACGADLMSDVLSFIKPGAMLLTGLTSEQVIYTAEMADIKVICFVRGKIPPPSVVKLARERGITLLLSSYPMFESCGRLYKAGMKGCSEDVENERKSASKK